MSKRKIRLDRLSKLEKHIRNGKLGHKKFDFSTFNDYAHATIEYDRNICGTLGCALGECPIVFSEDWRFAGRKVKLKRKSAGTPDVDAAKFFGLTLEEVNHLFYPDYQMVGMFCNKNLPDTATRKQVADNMKRFIEIKKVLLKNGIN